jgi:hypothetical protein
MSEKGPVETLVIKYNGTFDFNGLYNLIVDWLKDNSYEMEESFKHKTKEHGIDVELKLKGWRKENEYVKFYPVIFIKTFGMKDVEFKGKKIQKGRMSITINGDVEFDYAGEYEKNKLLKELRKWYHKYVYSQKYDMGFWWDKMYYHCIGLHNKVKEFLGMEGI